MTEIMWFTRRHQLEPSLNGSLSILDGSLEANDGHRRLQVPEAGEWNPTPNCHRSADRQRDLVAAGYGAILEERDQLHAYVPEVPLVESIEHLAKRSLEAWWNSTKLGRLGVRQHPCSAELITVSIGFNLFRDVQRGAAGDSSPSPATRHRRRVAPAIHTGFRSRRARDEERGSGRSKQFATTGP